MKTTEERIRLIETELENLNRELKVESHINKIVIGTKININY